MERVLSIRNVNVNSCGLEHLANKNGKVGIVEAVPVDDSYLHDGTFDVDAWEEDTVQVFFAHTKEAFKEAHRILRELVRDAGDTLALDWT